MYDLRGTGRWAQQGAMGDERAAHTTGARRTRAARPRTCSPLITNGAMACDAHVFWRPMRRRHRAKIMGISRERSPSAIISDTMIP